MDLCFAYEIHLTPILTTFFYRTKNALNFKKTFQMKYTVYVKLMSDLIGVLLREELVVRVRDLVIAVAPTTAID